jgi:hypothetical protein
MTHLSSGSSSFDRHILHHVTRIRLILVSVFGIPRRVCVLNQKDISLSFDLDDFTRRREFFLSNLDLQIRQGSPPFVSGDVL